MKHLLVLVAVLLIAGCGRRDVSDAMPGHYVFADIGQDWEPYREHARHGYIDIDRHGRVTAVNMPPPLHFENNSFASRFTTSKDELCFLPENWAGTYCFEIEADGPKVIRFQEHGDSKSIILNRQNGYSWVRYSAARRGWDRD